MTDPATITVRYPTWEWYVRDVPGMAGAPAWYEYVLTGFRELGCRVIIDPAMDAHGQTLQPLQYMTICIEADAKTATAVYDFNDFSRVADVPSDAYFKIQSLPGTGVMPIGQTLADLGTWRDLDALRSKAERPHRYDVVCLGRATCWEMRVQAARALKARADWRQLTGVSPYPRRPDVPADVLMDRMPRDHYLAAVASAKVVVALPGVGGDWTWRHTEAMALGACLLCPESEQLMPGDCSGCWAECRRDLSDLADAVAALLADESRRAAISASGREYFDRVLSPPAMASRIIAETLEAAR